MHYTLSEHAYYFLKEKLLIGELGPPGARVSDLELSKSIGISRTPVREAINQLATEGLLERRPRLGVFIKLPDKREIEELYDLRILLESYAAERAAQSGADGLHDRLRKIYDEMNQIIAAFKESGIPKLERDLAVRWFTADSAYHIAIIKATHNRHILKISSEMRLMTQILGHRRIDHDLKDLTRIYKEHGDILQAILDNKPDAARDLMSRHVQISKQETLESIQRREQPDGAITPISQDWPTELRHAIYRIENEMQEQMAVDPGENVADAAR
jgi:DNA-binding GntR family transcriptional regulator